jgi:hypothetical protein
MRSNAIRRVLDSRFDRVAIGSFTDLRRACPAELAAQWDEIAAEVDKRCAPSQQINRKLLAKYLRRVV